MPLMSPSNSAVKHGRTLSMTVWPCWSAIVFRQTWRLSLQRREHSDAKSRRACLSDVTMSSPKRCPTSPLPPVDSDLGTKNIIVWSAIPVVTLFRRVNARHTACASRLTASAVQPAGHPSSLRSLAGKHRVAALCSEGRSIRVRGVQRCDLVGSHTSPVAIGGQAACMSPQLSGMVAWLLGIPLPT